MTTKKKIPSTGQTSKATSDLACAARRAERAWLSKLPASQRASVPPRILSKPYSERGADLEAERVRWESRKHRRKMKIPAGLTPVKPLPGEPPGRLLLEWNGQRRPLFPGRPPSSWQTLLLELLAYSVAWRVQLANGGRLPTSYRWAAAREAEGIWLDAHSSRSGVPAWLTVGIIAWLLEHYSLRGGGGRSGKLTPAAVRRLLAEPTLLTSRISGLE